MATEKLHPVEFFQELASAATSSLRLYLPWFFSLALASERSDGAWREQWRSISNRAPPNGGWNWPSLRSASKRDPSRLCAAMWCYDEKDLCGLLLMRLHNAACLIETVEDSPNPHHPLKGLVIPTALELASMYAQAGGRREVWLHKPANDMLCWFLMNDYGFEPVSTRSGRTFFRRAV